MSVGPATTLSPFVHGTTDTTHVFFLESGSRRSIPDNDTLNFLLAGQTVRVLSDADLAAAAAANEYSEIAQIPGLMSISGSLKSAF